MDRNKTFDKVIDYRIFFFLTIYLRRGLLTKRYFWTKVIDFYLYELNSCVQSNCYSFLNVFCLI